jgi:hypothetical protein
VWEDENEGIDEQEEQRVRLHGQIPIALRVPSQRTETKTPAHLVTVQHIITLSQLTCLSSSSANKEKLRERLLNCSIDYPNLSVAGNI